MRPRRRREARREASTEEFDNLVALYREIDLQTRTRNDVRRTISLLGLTDREYADRWVMRRRGVRVEHFGDSVSVDSVDRDGRVVSLADLAYETATKPRG